MFVNIKCRSSKRKQVILYLLFFFCCFMHSRPKIVFNVLLIIQLNVTVFSTYSCYSSSNVILRLQVLQIWFSVCISTSKISSGNDYVMCDARSLSGTTVCFWSFWAQFHFFFIDLLNILKKVFFFRFGNCNFQLSTNQDGSVLTMLKMRAVTLFDFYKFIKSVFHAILFSTSITSKLVISCDPLWRARSNVQKFNQYIIHHLQYAECFNLRGR